MDDYQKYEKACEEIRTANEHLLEMPEWLATLARYDDPSVENVW